MALIPLDPDEPLDPLPPAAAGATTAAGPTGSGLVPLGPDVPLDDPGTSLLHKGEVVGSGLVRGAASLVGLPGDLAALARIRPSWLPTSPQTTDWTSRQAANLGMPLATAQSSLETYLNAGAEGVGSTLPLALIPGVGEAGLAARAGLATLQGAASGVGGEVGREALPNSPALGSLIGSLLGGGAAGIGLGFAGRGLAPVKSLSDPPPVGTAAAPVAAYDALNIVPRLAGDVTQNRGLQSLQATALRVPGGGRAEQALENTIGEFGNAVERTAARLNPTATDPQSTGRIMQTGGRQWLTQFNDDSAKAWGEVDSQIPADTPVPMSGVGAMLQGAQNEMRGMPATAAEMTEPVFGRLSQALQSDIAGAGGSGSLPWSDVRAYQRRAGTYYQKALVDSDPEAANWKQLYGALSDATGNAAAATDPAAAAAYSAAKGVTTSGHQFIDDVLSRIVNQKNPNLGGGITPESAVNFGLGADGTILGQLRAQMPDAADALGAYKLRSMARSVPSQGGPEVMSPGTYLTNFNKMQVTPQARAALFADPQTTQDMDNLATVANSMRNRYPNFSGTAGALAHTTPWIFATTGAGEGASRGWEEGGLGGALKGALLGAAAGGVLPFAAGRAISNIVARPGLTRVMALPSVVPATPWFGAAATGASPLAALMAPISGRVGRQIAATASPLASLIAGSPPQPP
jgi:hypothetical protein